MKPAYIAPEIDIPIAWTIDLFLPAIVKGALNIDEIEIHPNDVRRIRHLKDRRLMFMSNHPSRCEPPIAYYVANKMNARFYYIASRAVFDLGFGLLGELIKRIGAFSILTGGRDKEAIKTARHILSQENGKLVIYPEGMMTGENDTLIPFQQGAAQIAFWGLEDARKIDPYADIQILPAFIKYILSGTDEWKLQELQYSIGRIERELNIQPGDRNLLRRFLHVGRVLLEDMEKLYAIPKASESDYEYRVGRVRHAALNRAGNTLGIDFENADDAVEKIREVFSVIDAVDAGFPITNKQHLTAQEISDARKDLQRAYTFLLIHPDTLKDYPSPERFMEWIYRFESLLFGSHQWRPRKAVVRFADSFSLSEYYESYKADKRAAVAEVTKRIRHDMEMLIHDCVKLSTPIVEPNLVD